MIALSRRLAPGLYALWLLAVVLLLAGRYTGFPVLPGVHSGVVVGAGAFFLVGVGELLRDGYRRVAD